MDLPDQMKRAMARQAEAERERRAKVIAAQGELQASETLAQAAPTLATEPTSLQLRYLQTVTEIAAENNSTTIFPIPIDLFRPFLQARRDASGAAARAGRTARRAGAERRRPRQPDVAAPHRRGRRPRRTRWRTALPAPIDRAALERIIQRAAELQTAEREIGEGLTTDEVLALGREVGIPGRYLQQALLEERTRSPFEVGPPDSWRGRSGPPRSRPSGWCAASVKRSRPA